MAKQESIMIRSAYAYYAQLASPGVLKYKKEEDKDNVLVNKEYVVEVLMDSKELKALKKKWKKSVKLLREPKTYTEEEFEKRFKVKPPTDEAFETNDDGDIVYETIKLRKYVAFPTGKPTPLVKIIGAQITQGLDRKGLPVSQEIQDKENNIIGGESTLIGNGSLVKLQCAIRPLKNIDGDQSQFDLVKVQVLDLVVFQSSELDDGDFEDEGEDNGPSEGDFDDEGAGEGEAATAKDTPKTEAEVKDDDDF